MSENPRPAASDREAPELLRVFRTGVALDLLTLARLHDRELDAATLKGIAADRFPGNLALRLQTDKARQVLAGLGDAVASLDLAPPQGDELAADFAAIYLTHGFGASPCESVWLDDDGLAMQQPMFEVRGVYARHGLQAPDWRKRPDDHLVHQLHFVAALIDDESFESLREAARFLDEHTLRWMPDFAGRVVSRAATPFYAGLAALTSAYLDELRDLLARLLDEARPSAEEIERRMRPIAEVALPMPSAYVPGQSPSW
ncbi:MAG: molecular chaperone TorD family protein [Gammaproteobacteria bacterium]|nr:molecular chaperone TorD family protein [Gammaproteobacteria bacterium]